MQDNSSRSHSAIPTLRDSKYLLFCTGCSSTYSDDRLRCSKDRALLRTKYRSKRIELKDVRGVGRFHDWLPVHEMIVSDSGPITYKSTGLAAELGLKNLYVSFNGYWPEKRAFMETCSFKELEAFPTIQRVKSSGCRLVLASAGNTGRAFAHVSALSGVEVCIVVPGRGISRMWLPEEPTDSIHLIQMEKNCDYTDAIHLAERVASLPGMMAEGGARNVARRDGMGTVMLAAAFYMKRMPGHYFQAIGSGTGGIAAWEASLRLLQDGRFGTRLPKLHLSQNLPFTPMYNAWKAGRREIIGSTDMPNSSRLIDEMYDDVLSNREPPYSVGGGVYDALRSTNGEMYGIANSKVKSAEKLFERCEGIDILPSAGVAVASLAEAVNSQKVGAKDYILLNITGGGMRRLAMERSIFKIKPAAHAEDANVPLEEIIHK
nr:cysteate synthase [Candidatus Njordarchaeota archaeon]